MKKLTLLSVFAVLLCCFHFQSSANLKLDQPENWVNFYKHLGNTIKYPQPAVAAGLQGNSLITFTISEGKVKDFKITNELGLGCDVEVLNSILAYGGFKTQKPGKYALRTMFKLTGAVTSLKNDPVTIPEGFTELSLTVLGYAPKNMGIAFKTDSSKTVANLVISRYGNDVELFSRNSSMFGPESKSPLIVIDDQITALTGISTIDANSIKSVTVIKNSQSIVSYGEAGKNGVIIITTKNYVPKIEKKVPEVSDKN